VSGFKAGFFPGPAPPPNGHATRIVSLVPSQTELLFDLGLEDEVLGVTTFCVRPEGWKEQKQRVGGTKQVKVDAVRALEPDLVLANKEENTLEDVRAISNFASVYVSDVPDLPAALKMIRTVGGFVGRRAQARELVAEIEAGFAGLERPSQPVRAAYLIWREPWMSVGGDTFIHDLLARAGFENVFAEQPRYPEVTAQALTEAAPDVVLLSSEPFPFKEQHVAEVREALPEAEVHLVDGELCSWYGSRLRHAPAYLRDLVSGSRRG
jgi:ABC-type Fe3+-hydroxamate transport system substrate-binding protein